jgi:hypothetical protein
VARWRTYTDFKPLHLASPVPAPPSDGSSQRRVVTRQIERGGVRDSRIVAIERCSMVNGGWKEVRAGVGGEQGEEDAELSRTWLRGWLMLLVML